MRILFLCKWHPQQRDLIARPYGRFFHIPSLLADLGHDVRVTLIGHRGQPSTAQRCGNVELQGFDLRTQGPLAVFRKLREVAKEFSPDCIVGCSDAWVAWLAYRIAKAQKARLIVDAYDNFESYMPLNLPLHHLWRKALQAADIVTVAGPQLAGLLGQHARKVSIVPMAADPGFVARDRNMSRAALGLPLDVPLVGYFGGWAKNRGTDLVVAAFRKVRERQPDARLLVSGHPPPDVVRQPGVIATGYVPDEQLPLLTSAASVSCVVTADSAFGRYSYPAKLCEAMACRTPVAATATEPVRWMLGPDHTFLAPIGDADGMADAIMRALPTGRFEYANQWSWQQSAAVFQAVVSSS